LLLCSPQPTSVCFTLRERQRGFSSLPETAHATRKRYDVYLVRIIYGAKCPIRKVLHSPNDLRRRGYSSVISIYREVEGSNMYDYQGRVQHTIIDICIYLFTRPYRIQAHCEYLSTELKPRTTYGCTISASVYIRNRK
jgi:hypothetical protein